MSNLNILTDPFFPVVTANGNQLWVTFADLMNETGDCPVAFNWPRGDLNIASAELCIGLLALIYQPQDHEDWTHIWRGTSDVDVFARITALAPHFNLLGDANGKGPRFMQDFAGLDGEANNIEALFIDTPGVNGQNKNADLLTHRDRFPALGLKGAAIALYAMQQFAPSGGAGNRTSMRGGGPMTTLVLPERNDQKETPLWRILLANLPDGGGDRLENEDLPRALPWLAPTLTSEGKPPLELSQTHPAIHSLLAFFGMPRRIRLVVEGEGLCALTGENGPLVTGFIQKPWGMNYALWSHPLTPYRQTKEEPPYTVKPKSSRFGYRDWVGVVIGRKDAANKAFPALPVKALSQRTGLMRTSGYDESRMLAAGWAMNNMEAGSFLQSVQPVYLAANEEQADRLAKAALKNVEGADRTASMLRGAINEALFGGQAKSTDIGVFEEANDDFFSATEDKFHSILEAMLREPLVAEEEEGPDKHFDDTAIKKWLGEIRKVALGVFDRYASSQLTDKPDEKVAKRVTSAYGKLNGGLSDTSKLAKELGILQPNADPKTAKKSAAKKQSKEV